MIRFLSKDRLTTLLTIINERMGGPDSDQSIEWNGIQELTDHINSLNAWIDDLQSGMYVNCVYCGHRYVLNKDTPVSMADSLKAHIEECSQHPMSALKLELAAIKAKVFVEVESWLEASRMVASAQMYRDYYTPDLHDDELQEFNLIIGKFQTARDQFSQPPAVLTLPQLSATEIAKRKQ